MNSAKDIFNNASVQYQNKFMDMDLYHHTFDKFCESMEIENPEILEVGCGPGNITKYLLSKRPDFNILGTDIAPNMIELARVNNPTAQFKELNANDIATLDRTFDGVISGFCFPYLTKEEVEQFIQSASSLLHPGGLIYISTMVGNYQDSKIVYPSSGDQELGLFTHFHEEEYLLQFLTQSGFNVSYKHHQSFPPEKGNASDDMILLAKKED